jgi:hypothetical protein
MHHAWPDAYGNNQALNFNAGRARGCLGPNMEFQGEDDNNLPTRNRVPRSTTIDVQAPHYTSSSTFNPSDSRTEACHRSLESSADHVSGRQLNWLTQGPSSLGDVLCEPHRTRAQIGPWCEVESEAEHHEGDHGEPEHSPQHMCSSECGRRQIRRAQTLPSPFSFPEPSPTFSHARMSRAPYGMPCPTTAMHSYIPAAPPQDYALTTHREPQPSHLRNTFDAGPAFYWVAPASSHPSETGSSLDARTHSDPDFNAPYFPHR